MGAALLHLSALETLAAESEWAGDVRVPLVALREMSPDASWGMHALPKTEVEYIRALPRARLTLKAEHEAELAFRRGPDDHETKLEAELRQTGTHAEGWQFFMRTAALAAGTLEDSFGRFNALELAGGIRRNVQASRSSGSVELRVAHRDRTDGGDDFDRFAVKIKYRWPLVRAWRADTEITLNATQPVHADFRTSGNARLFVLRPARARSVVRIGGMLHVEGAAAAGNEVWRFGIGPAIAALW